MNETVPPPRTRARALRALGLCLSACLTAALTVATAPALAAAHPRRQVNHPRRATRRPTLRIGFARAESSTLTRWRPQGPGGLAARVRRERPQRCRDAQSLTGQVPIRDTDRAILCLLNRQRTDRGLPRLRLSRLLDRSAQNWTNTMVRDGSFSHGTDFGARISSVGFDWSQIGENIADGYRTPAGVVKAWMASTGHCENILSPDFREVGTGFDSGTALGRDSDHGTWTLDLGLLMRQRAPSNNWRPAEGCPY